MSSSDEDAPPQLVSSRNVKKRKRPTGKVVTSTTEKAIQEAVKNDHVTFNDKLEEAGDQDNEGDEEIQSEAIDSDEEAMSEGGISYASQHEAQSDSNQGSEEMIENEDKDKDKDEEKTSKKDVEDNFPVIEDLADSRFVFDEEDLDIDEPEESPINTTNRRILQPSSSKIKPGILYISRIPPGMSPSKLKSLLLKALPTHNSKGEPTQIGRLFLQPEGALVAKARAAKQSKKKTRRIFTEGWVEFPYRKLAKRAAETLNGMPMIPPSNAGTMSKRKATNRDPYVSDLWALKYLPSFKWDDLTSQLATERAARRERESQEIRRSKKEAEGYMDAVIKAKMLDKIQAKKRIAQGDDSKGDTLGDDRFREIKRQFAQRKPIETYSKDL